MALRNLRRCRPIRAVLWGLAIVAHILPASLVAQTHLPFSPGEELTYRMRSGFLGTVGRGTMSVDGPVTYRGVETLLLSSEMRSTVAVVRGLDRTRSWFDPASMRTLKSQKHERSPFASQDATVEVYGAEKRWLAADGTSGASFSAFPLDELSFLYFIRTLPMSPGSTHTFDRHFDTARNPITVRVIARERITVGAGEFAALKVEMRVRDPNRYQGEGIILIHLSDDASRIPLRIESAIPVFGKSVLTLESHTHLAERAISVPEEVRPQR